MPMPRAGFLALSQASSGAVTGRVAGAVSFLSMPMPRADFRAVAGLQRPATVRDALAGALIQALPLRGLTAQRVC